MLKLYFKQHNQLHLNIDMNMSQGTFVFCVTMHYQPQHVGYYSFKSLNYRSMFHILPLLCHTLTATFAESYLPL